MKKILFIKLSFAIAFATLFTTLGSVNVAAKVSPEACRYQDFQIKQDAKRNCATNECENDIIQIYQEYNKNCTEAKTQTEKNEVIDSFIKSINGAQERDRLPTIARNKSVQYTNRNLITNIATDSCADLDNPRPQTLHNEECASKVASCLTLPLNTSQVNECTNDIFTRLNQQESPTLFEKIPEPKHTPVPITSPQVKVTAYTTNTPTEQATATPLPTGGKTAEQSPVPITQSPTCDPANQQQGPECNINKDKPTPTGYLDEQPTSEPTTIPITGGTRFKLSNYPAFNEQNEEGDEGSVTQIFNSESPQIFDWTVSTIAEKPMVWLQYLDQNNNPGDPSYSENLQDGMTLFESATGFKIVVRIKERVTEVLVNGERVNPNSEIVVDLPGEENRAQFFTVEIIWRYNTGREEREFLGFDYIPEFEQQCEPGTPVNDCDNDKGYGHTYCVYDPDGNYEGGCSVEVCSNGGKPPDCEEEPETNEPEATPRPKPEECPSGCKRFEDGLCWRGPVEKVNDECPESYQDEDDPNTGCWGICE